MARRDPYSDPYDRPRYADGGGVDDDGDSGTSTVVTPPTPEAISRASGFVQQRQAAIDSRDKEVRDIQEKQQLNAEQLTKVLNETRDAIKRNRGSSTSLMKMGAAMMTTPGNFGTSLGAGIGALAKGMDEDRAAATGDEFKLADLEIKKMTLANSPLEQRMAYIKALQTGDIAAMRNIEQAMIKAQLAGTKTTLSNDQKNYEQWRQSPGNENKSFDDYLKFKAELKNNQTSDQKEYEMWKKEPGNEDKQFSDYLKFKQGVQARSPADVQYQTQMNKERAEANQKAGLKPGDPGFQPPLSLEDAMAQKKAAEQGAATTARETAEAQVKAKQSLPGFVANAERITSTIDKMLTHPGMDNAVGKMWANVAPVPGSPKADFLAMHDHLVGQAFMAAYERLRGAGAITEMEGLKAAQSELISARNQSKEAYMAALRQYQSWIKRSTEIMQQKAGMVAPNPKQDGSPTPTPPTATGSPSPPNQTSQTSQGSAPRAKMPDGSFVILKDGQWVPER